MPLDYSPKDASNCLPAGEYDAALEKVEDKVSKSSGQPMQVWTWRVYGDREMLVSDYVVLPGATFKIKQLAKALGKEAEFNQQRFQADDYIGAGVKLDLSIESQAGYEDKNRVGKIKAATDAPAEAPARTLPPRPTSRNVPSPIGSGPGVPIDDIPFAPNTL